MGGFVGGLVVSLIGSILGAFLVTGLLEKIISTLQTGFGIVNINIIAALIGGYFMLYIYNRINHDKKRQDY